VNAEKVNGEGFRSSGCGAGSRASAAEKGFTLTEVTVLVFMLGIVTVIVIQSVLNSIERARLVKCMAELRGIQAAITFRKRCTRGRRLPHL